jgi:ubiquinone/menaquinone biosynthesis C-methylase UbiE
MPDNPTQQRFQTAYEGKPPWDLGRPQKPFIEIADQITGSVLDVGSGTGDNALFFAQRGQPVVGIDFVEFPIMEARRKAEELGVDAEFLLMDALRLPRLGRQFDSVIDCGLFHVLSDVDRRAYVAALMPAAKLGGRLFLMCFSDQEPAGPGPRRIRQDEIRAAFADGWTVESIAPTHFEPNPQSKETFVDGGPRAWLAVVRRGS